MLALTGTLTGTLTTSQKRSDDMALKKQITIDQVAQQAGVSTQTVSRVLNNRPDVAASTRQRIQEIIRQLGYQPSAIARGLTRRRNHSLGVIVTELEQYGPMRRLLGIKEAATAAGYSLHLGFMEHPESDDVQALLNDLLSWQVEGIIWTAPEVGNNWSALENNMPPVPVILISERADSRLAAVALDNRWGARSATEHLLEQGYKNIGIITGPLAWDVAHERYQGWQSALLEVHERQVVAGDWSATSGERGLRQLIEQYPEMDAVFACNDQMALGAIHAANEMGLQVPRHLGVVGFDNRPESAYYCPPLTTVQHPLMEQGKLAVHKLLEMIETHQQTTRIIPSEGTVLKPRLIIRKSSVEN